MTPDLHITGDDAADSLLSRDPFALLLGMLLDQQVPMETAFAGPARLAERLGSADDSGATLDAAAVAAVEDDRLEELFRQKPSIHRFPGSMAGRAHDLATAVVDDWGGDTAAIWTRDDPSGAEVLARLRALPGFGDQKARIFLALLGKRYGVTPEGWEEASAPYGEDGSYRSVADIVDPESLGRVREHKRAAKAAAKAGKDG